MKQVKKAEPETSHWGSPSDDIIIAYVISRSLTHYYPPFSISISTMVSVVGPTGSGKSSVRPFAYSFPKKEGVTFNSRLKNIFGPTTSS